MIFFDCLQNTGSEPVYCIALFHPHPIEYKCKLFIHINFKTMANRPIQIQSINTDGSLQLSDNGNTTANPGDTIQWIINNNSGVATISSIHDTSVVDVFNPDPAKQTNSQNWQGTINPNITSNTEETYCIYYTIPGSSVVYNHDPKITVNV
jgi:hypothetical protein